MESHWMGIGAALIEVLLERRCVHLRLLAWVLRAHFFDTGNLNCWISQLTEVSRVHRACFLSCGFLIVALSV